MDELCLDRQRRLMIESGGSLLRKHLDVQGLL